MNKLSRNWVEATDRTFSRQFDGSVFDGQCEAHQTAVTHQMDVRHSVYNDFLLKWDYLATYHADGTATNSFGERRFFTGNKVRPWRKIEEGGEV